MGGSGWIQNILAVPLVLLAPITLQGLFTWWDWYVKVRQEHPDYSQRVEDLCLVAVITGVMMMARHLSVKYLWTSFGDWILPTVAEKKGKWTEESRNDRVQRFATVCFKFLYFLMITSWGFLMLRNEHWWPTHLGGSADWKTFFSDTPGFPIVPVSRIFQLYYFVQFSYHIQSLVYHVFVSAHRNDFIEMTLHHVVACCLVFFSYYFSLCRIGALVFFVHDTADVVGYLIKCSVDTKYTAFTLSVYACLLVTWAYMRLYVLPFYLIPHVDEASSFYNQSLPYGMYGSLQNMLYCLQFLHVYWYCLFLIMGYQYAVTGKTKDIQQKAGHLNKQNEKNNNKKKKDHRHHDNSDRNNIIQDDISIDSSKKGALAALKQRKPIARS